MTIARLALLPWLLVLAAAAGGDAFDLAVAALGSGSRAEHGGDVGRLRSAADNLRASRATPMDGSDDVLARWSRVARLAPPPPFRERVLGPGYRSLDLQAGGSIAFEQTFLAGRRARVAIVPVESTTFAMQIMDDEKTTICTASPPHGQCDWVPEHTSRVRIELRNRAHHPARYFVVMQ